MSRHPHEHSRVVEEALAPPDDPGRPARPSPTAHGGPHEFQPDSSRPTFLTMLSSHGDKAAMVVDGESTSYRSLSRQVDQWRDRLTARRIGPGRVVALDAAYSVATCAALLALIDLKAIVVPMVGLPAAKRAEFDDIAQVESVLAIDDDGTGQSVTHLDRTADHQLYQRLREAAAPGLVLFSSGTSGRSKASLLDFTKVLGRYGPPTRAARTLTFLNLDHIGGINTVLHTMSQGGTIVTLARRTPDSVFAAIAAHRVEVLPTTPTFLTMALVSGAIERHDTSSLTLITYGTEPMPAQTLAALGRVLVGVRLKQTYGLSELGILPTRSRGDDSLWLKLGDAGFKHKIVDDVLWIRSEMAMLGYLNAPAPFDEDGYFNTQDVVERDGEWVRILGRRSEVINVGGEKVYPSEVENVLLEAGNIADAVVRGWPSPVTGMVVQATVRLIRPEDERSVMARVRRHCVGRLEPYKVPQRIEISDVDQHSDRFKKMRVAA